MKKKATKIDILYIICTVFYVFFSYMSFFSGTFNINTVFLCFSIAFLGYSLITNYKNISIKKIDIPLILFIIYLLIHSVFMSANNEGIKYMIFFITINIISLRLRSIDGWSCVFINAILISTFIHCSLATLQVVFPEFILNISKKILNNGAFKVVSLTYSNNYYSGITNQPAVLAFFATVLMGLSISRVLNLNKHKVFNIICFLLGTIALLLSQKRSFLLASILAILVLLYVYNKNKRSNNKLLKIFALCIVIVVLGYIVIMTIPQTQNIINRLVYNDNFLSGREPMYDKMIEWFNQNPIFGVGLGSAEEAFGYGGHNIYLQMLGECGIVGTLLYLGYLIKRYIMNLKIGFHSKNISSMTLFAIYMNTILFVYGMTGNPIYDYLFLTLFTYIIIIPENSKKEENIINEEDKCHNTSI